MNRHRSSDPPSAGSRRHSAVSIRRGFSLLAPALFSLAAGWGWAGAAPTVATVTVGVTTETLKPFGYEIFQGQVREIVEGPIFQDYVVGPRDELLIQTWGEYTRQFPVRLSEDGDFYLEGEERRIFANGLTLREVQLEVFRALAQIHQEYFNWQKPTESKSWVEVRPIRVRPIIVYVTGEVYKPGTYLMQSSVASLLNVLTNAGGVKTTGSLRHLRVSRTEGKTEDLDLYDFLIRGDTKPVKTRLKYGETVFVDLKRKNVAIRGRVRRPGLYEMLDKESLADLLDFAGGPAPGAYLKRIQVVRRALNEGTRTVDVDYTELTDKGTTFALLDGDVVEIYPAVEEDYTVSLQGGGVYRTGIFQFDEGMTLADLIQKGEGLRGEAYLDKADLIRTRTDFTKDYRSFSLKELYRENPQTLKMDLIGGKADPANFPLRRLDKIVIYSLFEKLGKDKKVQLEGHVKQAGEHLLAKNMKLSDLLFAYGGFEDRDWRRATYLERADLVRTRPEDLSTTIIAIPLRRVLEGDPQADIPLESMDRIIVYSYDEIVKKDKFVRLEGHVKKPGDHPMSENMRLSDLLFAYGGFEDSDFKKATYWERADLYRTNPNDLSATVIPVNLGKVLAGDPEANRPLQSLDCLVVYEYKQFYPDAYFTIYGAVRDPGQYLLAQNTTLNDAIILASGLLEEAKYEAEIVRRLPAQLSANKPAEIIRVPISEDYASEPREKSVPLRKDDAVFIRAVAGWESPRFVRISGEVQAPGEYVLANAEERLSDLVRRAGSLKDTAYLPGVVFTRRQDGDSTSSAHVRVATDIKRALAQPGSPFDLILRDGDEVSVPINPMTIEVRGAVMVPAVLQYRRGRDADYYIAQCGGFTKSAIRSQVLVLNPDGTARRRGWGWFAPELLPGSVIVAPPVLPVPPRAEAAVITAPLVVEETTTSVLTTRPLARPLKPTPSPAFPIGRMPPIPAPPTVVMPTTATVGMEYVVPPAEETGTTPTTPSTLRRSGSPGSRVRGTGTAPGQPSPPKLPIP